jgi:hypothetical protein
MAAYTGPRRSSVASQPSDQERQLAQGRGGLRDLYHHHLRDRRRERLFLSSIGFFLAFAVARGMAHAAANNVGPFHFVESGGTHIHHLVWGILLLLLVSYLWAMQIGTGVGDSSRLWSNITSVLFGIGAGLALDEFKLWVQFTDQDYFGAAGRGNIDAVLFYGALLSIGVWGAPLFRALAMKPFHRG